MENFSKSKAYKKYYETCKKERAFFKKHGLSDENIEIIMNMTREQFKGDCAHNEHNYSLDVYVETMEEEGMNPFLKKYADEISFVENTYYCEFDKNDFKGAEWLYHIENEKLLAAVMKLSPIELKILTEIAINGKNIKEVSQAVGLTRQWTSIKYNEILDRIRIALLK